MSATSTELLPSILRHFALFYAELWPVGELAMSGTELYMVTGPRAVVHPIYDYPVGWYTRYQAFKLLENSEPCAVGGVVLGICNVR